MLWRPSAKERVKKYSRFIFGKKTVQFSTPDNIVCMGIKWPVYKQLIVAVCEACTTTDRFWISSWWTWINKEGMTPYQSPGWILGQVKVLLFCLLLQVYNFLFLYVYHSVPHLCPPSHIRSPYIFSQRFLHEYFYLTNSPPPPAAPTMAMRPK